MADTKNLYQRLLEITSEVGKIEKTGRNQQQGYAFIEQSQVVAGLRPLLAKYGVMVVPETLSRSVERFDVTRGNGKQGVDIHVQVKSQYTLVNVDSPDDRMVCLWDAGEALDTSDKASNKAVTASDKSFLMKLFNISDKDDPDRDHVEATSTRAQPLPANNQDAAPKKGLAPTKKQIDTIRALANELGFEEAGTTKRIMELETVSDASQLISKLEEMKGEDDADKS